MREDFSLQAQKEALTFDDILILPGYSEVLPEQISIKVPLAENLILKHARHLFRYGHGGQKHQMAREMARHGGFGVIHKNMSVKKPVQRSAKK